MPLAVQQRICNRLLVDLYIIDVTVWLWLVIKHLVTLIGTHRSSTTQSKKTRSILHRIEPSSSLCTEYCACPVELHEDIGSHSSCVNSSPATDALATSLATLNSRYNRYIRLLNIFFESKNDVETSWQFLYDIKLQLNLNYSYFWYRNHTR